MTAFRHYFDNLEEPTPKEQPQIDRYLTRRKRLFAELVQLIGQRHNYRVEKIDLIEGGYYPQGWEDQDNLQRANAVLVNELMRGRRALWVVEKPSDAAVTPLPISGRSTEVNTLQPNSKFPPPPKA